MDTIANFLTQIRNATMANLDTVTVTYSNVRYNIAQILLAEGYISAVKVEEIAPHLKHLVITLAYKNIGGSKRQSKITKLSRVSRPSQRVYASHKSIPRPLRGLGTVIISTSTGIVTGKEAYKKRLGGEVICEVW